MTETETYSEDQVEEMVSGLIEWLSKQPHLPHIEDRKWIRKFLVNCKYRLQNTKTKLENYYSARTNMPALFQNRDPTAKVLLAASTGSSFYPLPKKTIDGKTAFVVSVDPDPQSFLPIDYCKWVFMVLDAMLYENDEKLDYIVIVDFRGYSFQHFMKLTTIAKVMMDAVQHVFPLNFKGAHYVHVPSFIDRVVDFFKMLVKPKLRDRICAYKDIQDFYKIVGRDCLPSDLGGNDKSYAELNAAFQEKLRKYKDWFQAEESVRSNEALRPVETRNSWLMGTEGSFKKLTVE